MPRSAGTRLGVYEVLASIGAGGMGEVYRARDTIESSTIAPPGCTGSMATGNGSSDGRFLVNLPEAGTALQPITVILNWAQRFVK